VPSRRPECAETEEFQGKAWKIFDDSEQVTAPAVQILIGMTTSDDEIGAGFRGWPTAFARCGGQIRVSSALLARAGDLDLAASPSQFCLLHAGGSLGRILRICTYFSRYAYILGSKTRRAAWVRWLLKMPSATSVRKIRSFWRVLWPGRPVWARSPRLRFCLVKSRCSPRGQQYCINFSRDAEILDLQFRDRVQGRSRSLQPI
jgi:hypothetical protein